MVAEDPGLVLGVGPGGDRVHGVRHRDDVVRSVRDPDDPEVVLGLDMLAPEGYGEIIGGSQRIHDHDLLLSRIRQHELPVEAFQWYLDVRKYGSFPHSGFGMGLERFTAWMCGVPHLRECIPYPRMLYRIYP